METPTITANRIRQYLLEDKRFDGRDPDEFRDLEIEMDISKKAEGSVKVKLGKTEVIVGVKMGVMEPYPDSPDKGNLITTAELLPLSSPRVERGRPGIESIEIGRVIDRCIRESGFIDFEKLCIKEGEKVWTIFIDIYSINDDGNILDAAAIGTVIALKNAKMPKYDEKEEKLLHDEHTDKSIPLTKEIPLSLTIYKIGDKFIVDPTREEEDIIEARVTIGSYEGSISSIQKGEESSLTIDQMSEVLDMNEKVWNNIFKQIKKHL
ncbi:exosome complex protein Rrp42 [Candidatus Pacearchaeota archaeon]|nr:exosome complex protein Rrp42 [Candidatus Pacearchaeota archaeon]